LIKRLFSQQPFLLCAKTGNDFWKLLLAKTTKRACSFSDNCGSWWLPNIYNFQFWIKRGDRMALEAVTAIQRAEEEAAASVEQARQESEQILRQAQLDSQQNREAMLERAREDSKSILDRAEKTALESCAAIVEAGQREADKIRNPKNEKLQSVVNHIMERIVSMDGNR